MTYLDLITGLGIALAVFLILFVGCALKISSELDDLDRDHDFRPDDLP